VDDLGLGCFIHGLVGMAVVLFLALVTLGCLILAGVL